MQKWQDQADLKRALFEKISDLRKLTLNQRKTLMANDLETYLSIEKNRSDLRKEINEIKNNLYLAQEEYKSYVNILNEMLKLEEDNQRIILEWYENVKDEQAKFRNIKKITEKYFNKKNLTIQSKYINRIT